MCWSSEQYKPGYKGMRKHRMCGSVAPGDLEWAEDGRGCLKFDFQINGPNVQAKKPLCVNPGHQRQTLLVDHCLCPAKLQAVKLHRHPNLLKLNF